MTQKTLKPLIDEESGVVMAYELLCPLKASVFGKIETLPAGTAISHNISSGSHPLFGRYEGRKILTGQHKDIIADFPADALRA